jgi:hypothetical protein
MPRLWYYLGNVALFLALFGLIHQSLILGSDWNWSQFWHHESLIAIALCVGVALLVVSTIENIRG